MFDLSISEIAIIVIIATVVIGPKELPRALATAGRWAAENERIMTEYPALPDASLADDAAAQEPRMEPLDGPPADASGSPDPINDRPDLPPAGDAKS